MVGQIREKKKIAFCVNSGHGSSTSDVKSPRKDLGGKSDIARGVAGDCDLFSRHENGHL